MEMQVQRPPFDEKKFQELMLYIGERGLDDPRFGKVKLAKTLFYADFTAFLLRGEPITGATYRRLPLGPVPAAFDRQLRQLEEGQAGFLARARYYSLEQHRLIPLREADLSVFSAEEIALVDTVIEALRDHDAASVSAMSHLEASWRLTNEYEPIPYELAFLSMAPLSEQTVALGQEVAAQHGLLVDA